jgi:hypothetical protein
MIIGTLVGLAGGYLSGRHLPPVLRVLPAGFLLLDGHALFMLAHAHGGYFFGPFLLYIACAFAGMSKRKPFRPDTSSWWWHSLDMVALAAVWVALFILYALGEYYRRLAGLPIV